MLGEVVDEAAARFGDATAYVAADGWLLSFAELARASDEVAAGLAAAGVGAGDVVALALPSIPEYVIAYAAAAKLGAVTAGVNARLTSHERAGVLATARPHLVVATPDLAPHPDALPAGADLVTIDVAGAPGDALAPVRVDGGAPRPLDADPDRPVAIVFTSGTTGQPKGAVFGGRQLAFITQVDTGGTWAGQAGAAQLAGTSFAHLGPMTKLPGNLMRGACTVLVDRWRPGDALALIERYAMAGVGGIPTQVALMLRHPSFDERDLSSVRAIVMGGGPSTPSLVREARRRFGAAVSVRYSCTEAGIGVGTAFDAPPEDAEVSVGRPHTGVTLTIRADDGTVLPPGAEGEVCLASPATMRGYWRDPDATAAAMTADGAVRTGDVGHLDAHGRLVLAGRRRDRYVRGGYNVHPLEVEAVLATHPAVADVAVVARPDDVMGEVGVAVVVAGARTPAPTLDELRAHGATVLAHHKLPEDLVVVDALPLTAMEKVDRRALESAVRDAAGPKAGSERSP